MQRKQWVLLIRPSGIGSMFAGIPSHPCLLLGAQVMCSWCRARASPGHREASGSWLLPGKILCLPLASGRLSLRENIWVFFPCFEVLKVWVFGYPSCPLPSLQHVCCQIQMPLVFVSFCPRSSTTFWLFSFFYRCHHNEPGDIYNSSFLLVLDFLLLEPSCEEKAPGDQAVQ